MKKRGVTYTEILVAITIFSLGIVPLMLSLNSAFEATVFNRDYTKALEYNAQLMEEISAMMPTKVPQSNESSKGYKDLDELAEDVRGMVVKRSEKSIDTEGIYSVVQWNGSGFNFSSSKLIDSRMYREIKVEGIRGDSDEGKLKMDIEIDTYKIIGDKTIEDDLITRSYMTIHFEGEDGGSELIGEGSGGGIDIPPKEDSDETDEIITPNKEANFVRVILQGSNGNAGKMEEVSIKVNNDSFVAMQKSDDQSSNNNHVFEKSVIVPANSRIVFKVGRGDSNGRLHNTELKYELHYRD